MTKFVSYVPDEAIEKDAQALLAEYAHARGVPIEAPIAIDDIIEKHLKIGIEFDDTHRLFPSQPSRDDFRVRLPRGCRSDFLGPDAYSWECERQCVCKHQKKSHFSPRRSIGSR